MKKVLYRVRTFKCILMFFAIGFVTQENALGQCYKVSPLQGIGPDECGEIPVSVEKINCDNPSEVIKAYRSRAAKVDCGIEPKVVKTPFDAGYLLSELKSSEMWGKVSLSLGESKYVKDASFRAPVEKNINQQSSKAEDLTKKENLKRLAKVAPKQTDEQKAPVKEAQPVVELAKEETKEKKIEWNASGFIWMEGERSKNFGYDADSGLANFSNAPQQGHSSMMANLELSAKKADTGLYTLLEVGELFAGDESTGGAVGSRGKILELRNLYFSHNFSEQWSASFGIKGIVSDPNAYIVSDDYYMASVDYGVEGSEASIWLAQSAANRPGINSQSEDYVETDRYVGAIKTHIFNDKVQGTGFFVGRHTRESFYDLGSSSEVSGNSFYGWLGSTWNFSLSKAWTIEGTGIYNMGRFLGDSSGPKDTMHSYLADLKVNYAIGSTGTDIGLEGLVTYGSKNGVSEGQELQTLGKRGGFVSVGPTYLLTIATSDGADDAPGSPKESTIGDLNQSEGIQIAVLKVDQEFSDVFSGLVRYGFIRAANTARSSVMGHEFDLQLTYKISDELSLQGDLAFFVPGSYFDNDSLATLMATRLTYSF